jgi:GNAT superfamily N-acetyltransferase
MDYDIRPISAVEWLPDRCLGGSRSFDPKANQPESGCTSLDEFYTHGSREKLEGIYRKAIEQYGGCGFVAWHKGKVVGYNNFFPREIATDIRFYGWGTEEDVAPKTLVHNCISILGNDIFRRKGIGTNLMLHSLRWAKSEGWKRMEVHLVLPNVAKGFANEQKSGRAFWEKLGFSVFRSEEACAATKEIYGVNERYSMAVDLNEWSM